jgi:hypothetical protein
VRLTSEIQKLMPVRTISGGKSGSVKVPWLDADEKLRLRIIAQSMVGSLVDYTGKWPQQAITNEFNIRNTAAGMPTRTTASVPAYV